MSAKLVNAILQALPISGTCMKIAELIRVSGFTDTEVSATCCKLISRKLVERVRPGCFRLTAAGQAARKAGLTINNGHPKGTANGGIRRPREDTLRARLWDALRATEKASVGELLTIARRGTESDAPRDAQRYFAALAAAGIVRRMPRKGADGEYRYFLHADPGPVAPIYRRSRGEVFDPNTGRSIDVEGVS